MALAIYETENLNSAYSVSGVFTNPFAITFDGVTGGVSEKQLFVGNNSADYQYTGIVLSLLDNSGQHLIDGTNGFSWKLSEGSTQPLEAEWDTIDDGNSITIPNIDTSPGFRPFWLRIAVPRATSAQSFDQILMRLSATESLI